MSAIWIHYLLFASVIGVGCIVLSGLTRLIADCLKLEYLPRPLWKLLVALFGIGCAGAVGQVVFQLLYAHWGISFTLSRLFAWILTGMIVALSTELGTPFMPRLRTSLVGAIAGIIAWIAFCWGVGHYGDIVARILSAVAVLGVMPLAVLLPLPEVQPVTEPNCPECEECTDRADEVTIVPDDAQATYESVGELLTGTRANPGIPGKAPLRDKIGVPGKIALHDHLRRGGSRPGSDMRR